MTTFNLPELGEGLEEGEIVSWRVTEGGEIKADQTLVEVMTDKATIEVPSPTSGKVLKLYYKVGELAKVGAPLIDIQVAGEAAVAKPSEAPVKEVVQEVKREATSGHYVPASTSSSSAAEKVLASPAVRKMARSQGIDLSQISGSGDRGRVLRTDLDQVGASGAAAPATSFGASKIQSLSREERIPYVGVRRKIGEQLSRSMYTAVHFTHHDEADFYEIMRMKNEANEFAKKNGMNTKVTFLPFFIKAAIWSLKKHPILNASLDEKTNEIVIKNDYHFGISVQTPDGLMVAVVRDCDRKNIFEIASDIQAVVDRARTKKASTQDLTGSTITITNVGSIGGLHATPVINFPEVAILGMYEIKKRPVVKEINGEDQIVIRPMMYVNITCDHRIVDGAIAAEFLKSLVNNLENPARMAFW